MVDLSDALRKEISDTIIEETVRQFDNEFIEAVTALNALPALIERYAWGGWGGEYQPPKKKYPPMAVIKKIKKGKRKKSKNKPKNEPKIFIL